MTDIHEGDKVICKRGNIDKNVGEGLSGTVGGFARLSSYHAREAFVSFGETRLDPHPANGWFWLSDLAPANTEQ